MAAQDNTDLSSQDIRSVLGLGGSGALTWPQRYWKPIAVAFALAALILYGLLATSGPGDRKRYMTAVVQRADLTVIVTATGTVQPTNQVDISSELSGTVRKVLVDYNSHVKKGQILAELDTDKLKASVESAKARLLAAEARVKNSEATRDEMKVEYDRKLQLVRKRVSSTHELDAAKAAYARALAAVESARADVAAAAADLKLNETNLAKSCICSPINGIVLKRDVEPGQTVASSLQAPVLFTIAEDLSKMEVQVDVDEADVGRVRQGQNAGFSVDAYPDKKFAARIKELRFGSEVVQGVVTYKAVLSTQNSELLLRPGMTATAEITVEQVKDTLTVPNAALRFSPETDSASSDDRSFLQKLLPGRPRLRRPSSNADQGGSERSVYTLEDGGPKKITVTVGASDGRRTQIVKGDLEPGQMVITDVATSKN